jgi:hypothetical protein
LKRRARAIGFIGEIQFSGPTCVRSLCTPLKTISTLKTARCGLRAVNMSAQQVHASHKGVGFSAAVTCRCVAIASPSPSGTGHAGWAEVRSARSPSSQTPLPLCCVPLVVRKRCPLANDLPACLVVFHICGSPADLRGPRFAIRLHRSEWAS